MATRGERVLEFAIRRGFLWQSYEIYGGVAGFYDLGPLGVLLKSNIVDLWRRYFVLRHQDMVVEIETPMITPAVVFRASGHEEHFTDYAVQCKKCGRTYRADHLVQEVLGIDAEGLSGEELEKLIRESNVRCPACGGELGEVKKFLLLFTTYIGPYSPENLAYLRPEAAQGMFVNFKRVYELMRRRMPLGIAQIGRVARNEISPRQGPVRLREFTIMEIEFFYDPHNPRAEEYLESLNTKIRVLRADQRSRGEDKPVELSPAEAYREGVVKSPWLAYWMGIATEFVNAMGVPPDRMYFEEKLPQELAHYSKQTFDQIVITERFGKLEVSGHAYRHSYDLERHMTFSGADLTAERILPQPKEVKRKVVKVDKALILSKYRERAREIFKALSRVSPDQLLRMAERSDSIVVEGVEIPRDVLKVVEEVERIAVEKFVPHVVEPSFGAERLLYVALEFAYTEEGDRVVMRFPPYLAPIKIAVFPLVEREPLVSIARNLFRDLSAKGITAYYDESGSIGRRYVRADEMGIPLAITVDYDTPKDGTVTVRDRDTRKQVRIPISELYPALRRCLEEGVPLTSLGYPMVTSKS